MMTLFATPAIYMVLGVVLISIILGRLFFKNYWLAYFRKHSDSVAIYYQTENEKLTSKVHALTENVQKLENDIDLLWIQLFHWREFAEENRAFRQEVLSTLVNKDFHKLADELDQRFVHLSEITESNRQQYFDMLRKKEDYGAEFNKVIANIAIRFSGMNLGEKAGETPILNSNREN